MHYERFTYSIKLFSFMIIFFVILAIVYGFTRISLLMVLNFAIKVYVLIQVIKVCRSLSTLA